MSARVQQSVTYRHVVTAALGAALLACASASPVAQEKGGYGGGQVVERCGTFGNYRIGASVQDLVKMRLLGPTSSSTYRSLDRNPQDSVEAIADGSGRIIRLRTARRGVFTQRYIVIGDSTFDDVLQRYGRGVQNESRSEVVLGYPYEGIVFSFPADQARTQSGKVRLSAIALNPKQRDPSGADHSCPFEQGNYKK